MAAVEALFADWEAELSRFRTNGGLSHVNGSAGHPRPAPAGPLLRRVVRRALEVAAATDGVFDPTLGAEIATLGYDATFDRIDHAGSRNGTRVVGGAWRQVEVDDAARTITLPAGARFDLGGIAKGMAVDASLSPLVGVGAETALVNAGGDMAVSGPLDQSEGWPVEVQTHDGPVVVSLLQGALATSTTRRRRWLQAGVACHHLLDPATGLPSESNIHTATVTADSL